MSWFVHELRGDRSARMSIYARESEALEAVEPSG
jgi:hypothetical protein